MTISGSATGLSVAVETSAKTLPGTPKWFAREPNTYSSFGSTIKTAPREFINAGKKVKKGPVVDKDSTAGWNEDLTFENSKLDAEVFLAADMREAASTAPQNGTAITITGVVASSDTFTAASGLTIFKAGDIILAENFTNAANNGIHIVSAADATTVTVGDGLVDETPGASAKITVVGYQFATAELDVTAAAASITLTAGTTDPTDLDLNVGQWVFVGGDDSGTAFTNNVGFGRVSAITATTIVLDETTWTGQNETGTGLTVQLFFCGMVRDEAAALLTERYLQCERTLGSDGDGTQSQYITGCVPSEWKINFPLAALVTKDVSFVGLDEEFRDGTTGVKSGTRVTAVTDDGWNTTSHVYRKKMFVIDPAAMNNTALFARLMESSITVGRDGKANKEIGTLGGFEGNTGNINVKCSANAYFDKIDAQSAITGGSDVAYNMILSKQNKGIVFDLPLIGVGGGQLQVENNEPIKLPLDCQAGVCDNGYTMSLSLFAYLPDVAMA